MAPIATLPPDVEEPARAPCADEAAPISPCAAEFESDDVSTEAAGSEATGDHQEEEPDRCCVVPLPVEDTLIFIDWDDTLFPTTWIQQFPELADEASFPSAWQQAKLDEVAEAAAETLATACRLGKVVIVTNAKEGWVELCCRRFVPALGPLLKELRVVSARSAFERRGRRHPGQWKTLAFREEVVAYFGEGPDDGRPLNVIGMGDSVLEHDALLRATQGLPNCYAKSMKFAEAPQVDQLVDEHRLVSGSLEEVAAYEGDLDIEVGGA